MAQLAIKGHTTRGEEVINILEMLGGSNEHNYSADCDSLCFYIGKSVNTIYWDWSHNCYEDENTLVLTLEEFIKEFPYKVGDNVSSKYLKNYKIEKMEWEDTKNNVIYKLQGMGWYTADELKQYKEETMEKEISGAIVNRFICLEGYDFYDDKGNVIDTKEITMKKKQPKYPKTYEECHELMVQWKEYDCNPNSELVLSEIPVHDFCKLIVARNIYWKIAGEEMGLGKPWEPDWTNEKQIVYGLYNELKYSIINPSRFVFPTEEMRDDFYDNFKEMIECCKELL